MAQNVYRSVSKNRSVPRRSERARPAGLRREARGLSDDQRLSLKRWIAVLGLLPLGLVTALTLVEMFWRALVRLDFWRSEPLVFFMLGGAAWWLAYLGGLRPMHTYVFGHEVSHLLMARAFGGKIYDWNHGAAGGYVETDKANTWITLAPYLIPLYALGVLALFGIAALFWDLNVLVTVDARLVVFSFKPVWLFYVLLGLTWWFHATYTCKTVAMAQSDLQRNGEFFSMLLIFLVNVLLLALLLIAASSSPGLGLAEVGRCWLATAVALWDFTLGRFW